jgi:hypothetical protein
MSKFKVTRNFRFADILKDVEPTESDMRRAGEDLADQIRERTTQGLDEDRRKFAPYAASTLARSAKRSNTRGPIVDLSDTGQMMADLGVVRASRKGFGLGFRTRRSEKLADFHTSGAGRLPVRRFLGIPQSWINDLIRRLKR